MTIGGGVTQHSHISATSGGELPGIASAERLLQSQVAAASASLDFALAGYDYYRFVCRGMIPSVDLRHFSFQISTDGGSSFIATGYEYMFRITNSVGTTATATTTGTDILLGSNQGNLVQNDYEIEMFNARNAAQPKHFRIARIGRNATPAGTIMYGMGLHPATTGLINAIRFLYSAGATIVGGTIQLFGANNT